MWSLFKEDCGRWVRPSEIAAPEEVTLPVILGLLYNFKPVRAMLLFRLGTWAKAHRVPLLTGVVYRWLYTFYGLEIAMGGQIGGGLYVPHTVGMVISPRQIGRNCSIIHGVTIGQLKDPRERPVLGDNVFVGAGARILGGVTLGDGALVGANAVVVKDVPAGATAVGVPARLLSDRRDAPPSPAIQQVDPV